MTAPSSSSVESFYDADADRIYVEAAPPRDPWGTGRVRLTHVLRDDNGIVDGHVLDLVLDDARAMASAIFRTARDLDPVEASYAVREGARIRHRDGRGYGDSVPDADIERHLEEAEAQLRNYLDQARFCHAVLQLRAEERS